MAAYYNEFDPKAAAWLRELIKQGHIADGVVDERSIEDVTPNDLNGFTQCHFFAGIGVWSYALRRAGWADDRPIWTGSCPCQPFSAAGKGAGFDDERHLWPAFNHLISQCRPDIVLGEQVASKDGLAWLDLVQADLEAAGYASGAVDLCAAGIGAPHIRQRLWWVGSRVGNSTSWRKWSGIDDHGRSRGDQGQDRATSDADGLADTAGTRQRQRGVCDRGEFQRCPFSAQGERCSQTGCPVRCDENVDLAQRDLPSSPTNGFWRDADWLFCRDGKWRPVEPSTSPLAHGPAARVGRLRGYGNAIVAPAAQVFIEAVMESM